LAEVLYRYFFRKIGIGDEGLISMKHGNTQFSGLDLSPFFIPSAEEKRGFVIPLRAS
jgi:hypothetical protein